MERVVQEDLSVDKRIIPIVSPSEKYFKTNGWEWFLGGGEWTYLGDHLIGLSRMEAMEYIRAADDLYRIFEEGVQYVIDNNLWMDLGIHPNLVEQIRFSWTHRERHQHLYGRFDFAGGINGQPVKLLEFNADTPTTIPETAFIQREQMIHTKLGNNQFNTLFDDLVATFERLGKANPGKSRTVLFTSMGHKEDEINARTMMRAAEAANFEVDYEPLEDVIFSADDGIFVEEDNGEATRYDFWFKLVPWEYISHEEPELMDILNKLVLNGKVTILNPAYSLVMQSKALMKYLYDLHPNHPHLLKTSFEAPSRNARTKYVEKVLFGREGENVTIYDENNFSMDKRDGNYGKYNKIYQDYAELPNVNGITYYQPMVYWTGNPSAISFRKRDSLIMDEDSEFIGHLLT